MNKLEFLKMISRELRLITKEWAANGNELNIIKGIINLDVEIYKKIDYLERELRQAEGERT